MNAFPMGAPFKGDLPTDNFGESVAANFDGSIVATGTPEDNVVPSLAGVVRVYQWNNGWTQMGGNLVGEALNDFSATSISLDSSGTRLAIVAKGNDGNNPPDTESGQLRVYEWNGTAWIQMGNDIDGVPHQFMGQDVSLSGDGTTVAVSTSQGWYTPKVQIYQWNGVNWIPKGSAVTGNPNDFFGQSIDLNIDGTVLAVGASNAGNNYNGSVTVYVWNGTSWIYRSALSGGNQSFFGRSVSLSGDGSILAAGSSVGSGYAKISQWNGTYYQILGQLIFGDQVNSGIGYSVSMNNEGSRVALTGLYGNGNPAGETVIYHFNGTGWVKLTQDIANLRNVNGTSSLEVDMSGDGNRLIIGHAGLSEYYTDTGVMRVLQIDTVIPCQSNIVINGSPLLQPAVESMDWIQTSGTVIVPNGNVVRLDADISQYVTLNPGFRADSGSTFIAQPFNGCQAGTPNRPQFEEYEEENSEGGTTKLKVYPNPTSAIIYIDPVKDLKEIKLFDITGHLLKTAHVIDGVRTEIDLNEFTQGIYCIQAMGFKPVKVVKQ